MKKKPMVSLLALLLLATIVFAGVARVTRAPGETVNFYANITAIEPLLEDFEARTGVRALYTRISTTQFLATVFTEFEAGRLLADVIQAPLPVMEQLQARGILAPHTSPSAVDFPEWARRGHEGIYLFAIEYVSIIYNRNLINPEDVPRRYQDLADPRWRNMIVMPNPSIHATTISWLVSLRDNVFDGNDAEWREFLHGLAANNPMFVASFGPTPAPISTGERPIGISMPKYIVTHAPAPLSWAQIEPVMGSPRAIGISSSARNPEAARQFVDYWLSAEAGRILADDVGEYVLTPGVFPPIAGMDTARVIPVRDLSDTELTYWSGVFRAIFN
ncbi:MAG: extracellular solute-binding protein [Treponema sp.]|nr:extracellular solute-binding protein [Treponema sp.]